MGDMDFSSTNAEEVVTLGSNAVFGIAPGDPAWPAMVGADVRQYKSYYMNIGVRAVSSNPSQPITALISAQWYLEPTANTLLYEDVWEVYGYNIGPFPYAYNAFMAQDNMHGPYMSVSVQDTTSSGTNVNESISYSIFASTRVLPGQSFRENNSAGVSSDAILAQITGNITNGTTKTVLCPVHCGPVMLEYNTGNSTFNVNIYAGSLTNTPIFATALTASSRNTIALQLPKRGAKITISNTGASTVNLDMNLIAQYQNL